MLLVDVTREGLLRLLPPAGEVAEIGTARGDFAAAILASNRPRRLHLIDPWEHQADAAYAADPNNLAQDDFDRRLAEVAARFAEPLAAGVVTLHRAYSPAAAAGFADASLDWIYVDGMHTRDAVLADLRGFDAKVKPGGLILGHDYTTHPDFRALGFGVVEAVNQFIAETGYTFVCLTYEGSPTYALAKDPASPMARHLFAGIMYTVQTVVEIEAAEHRRMTQHDVTGPDGKAFRTVIGFG